MKLLTKFINLFKQHPIQVGQMWYYSDDIGNPFKKPREAKVIEYENNWVKYEDKYGLETMKEDSFRHLYQPNKT